MCLLVLIGYNGERRSRQSATCSCPHEHVCYTRERIGNYEEVYLYPGGYEFGPKRASSDRLPDAVIREQDDNGDDA